MSWIPPLKQPIDRQHIIEITSLFVNVMVRVAVYARQRGSEGTFDRFSTRLHRSPFQKSKDFSKTKGISSENQQGEG